ncbi:pentatricopeptide repeat-containing protein At3g23020-like [Vicia villosa]|uniref:pentatricopeptide repeat-containing protein At3g23020-like n=1 Tax=Vicia villosa TaxID=3911 RepID=UPI00273A8853|nr:pentatricopeptide repeat-containing protein At3g23020-like [Vicia villosa]
MQMFSKVNTNALALVAAPRENSLPTSNKTTQQQQQQQTLLHPPKKLTLQHNYDSIIPNKRGDNNTDSVLKQNKVHSKCLTKWASYSGRLPAILHALDTIHDLDKALKPWEKRLSKKEISIILNVQVYWKRALKIFEWFKKKGCYELNVIHYNIMFSILGKRRKWSLVMCLWNEMNANGVAPVNSTYGTLIDVYGKGGLKQKALGWLQMMQSQGMEPDEVTMGVVVQLYKKTGEFRKAEEFFRKWSRGEPLRVEIDHRTDDYLHIGNEVSHVNVCLNTQTYTTLIDTHGKAGHIRAVSEIFAMMIKHGVVPTTVTFNTMIHLYGSRGHIRKVSLLLQRMEELGCPPDTTTYNILICVCVKHNDINLASKYLAKMKEAFLEPDLASYCILLCAYSTRKMVQEAEELIREMDERGLKIDELTQSSLTRMYVESGMLEKSWLWFMRFHQAGNIASTCYSANIDAYAEKGYTLEAEKVFMCCKERKRLRVTAFNVMIKAYGKGKCYDKACQLFDSMEKFGIVANTCSYSSLIHILSCADKPHIAKPYLNKMQEAGLVSDCVPYCAVISSFAKLGQLNTAEALYNEMIKYAVQPDVIIYGVLIKAFADAGNVKKATKYVYQMKKAGFSGNPTIHNTLIKLYAKLGYLEKAQETYKLLQSSDQGPSLFSSNCMIDLYTERLMVKEATKIFESLKKDTIANEFSYAMMLCMHKKMGRLDKAIQIAKQMRNRGLMTDLLSYNHVLGLYSMDRKLWEAKETFKEMIESGIQPDDFTFRALKSLLLNFGVSKQNIGRLELAMKWDGSPCLHAWMVSLSRASERLFQR